MWQRFKNTRLYDWLSLRNLTRGLTSGEIRAIRTTNGIQLTFFTVLLFLVPQVLLVEPPETHFFSMMLFAEIVAFFIAGRIFLYRRFFATARGRYLVLYADH